MKKVSVFSALLFAGVIGAKAQTNLSVPLSDPVYDILEIAQIKGMCSALTASKPYTEKKIVAVIDEILSNESIDLSEKEIEVLTGYRDKYIAKEQKNNVLHVTLATKNGNQPFSFNYDLSLETSLSTGFYNESKMSSTAFEIIPTVDLYGDITRYLSYRLNVFMDFTKMPLYEPDNSSYEIGSWYYSDGPYAEDYGKKRTVKKLYNNSYLPFQYNKRWGGQCYFFSNISADGLEGWPTEAGYTSGIDGELRASLLDNKVNIGIGRVAREIAGMDNGASLVLNARAKPFYAVDATVDLLPWLRFSWLTGILEYPNQDYMQNSDYYGSYRAFGDDAYFFQNAFSLIMFELNVAGFHFDFGSTSVWPKRFELGYLIPIAFYVEYQNHIGDYDNLAMFADLKFSKENQSFWGSFFLDEISAEVIKGPFLKERAMFAVQAGYKYILPVSSFASVSFRYTKVEPYCYTHQSINYTPWYNHYINENYTNNGECLGYYLPPNSDEFLLLLECRPKSNVTFNASYQLVRHGADYGSHQVRGSSLYSELPKNNRGDAEKHFIEDGAYNWMHILSIGASYKFKNSKIPVEIYGNAGLLISHYSDIDAEDYTPGAASDNTINNKGKMSFINTDEYPVQIGAVFSVGLKIHCK